MQKKHSDYKLNGKSLQELETRKYKYSKKTPIFTEALFNFLVEAGESRTPHLEYWIIHSDVLLPNCYLVNSQEELCLVHI
jgi:hypothetical protein